MNLLFRMSSIILNEFHMETILSNDNEMNNVITIQNKQVRKIIIDGKNTRIQCRYRKYFAQGNIERRIFADDNKMRTKKKSETWFSWRALLRR